MLQTLPIAIHHRKFRPPPKHSPLELLQVVFFLLATSISPARVPSSYSTGCRFCELQTKFLSHLPRKSHGLGRSGGLFSCDPRPNKNKSDVALIRKIHSCLRCFKHLFFLCSKWGSTLQAICAVYSSHFSRTLAVKCCTLRCRRLTEIRQNLGWIPLLYAQIRQASLVNCSNWALQSAALLASVPDQQAFLPRHKIRKKR